MNNAMPGSSSLSNKHVLTRQRRRGTGAGTPGHIPVPVVCSHFCSPWGHLTFLPVLTWPALRAQG